MCTTFKTRPTDPIQMFTYLVYNRFTHHGLGCRNALLDDLLTIYCHFLLSLDWRLFDDSMVSLVRDSQVMTRAGYVLFYRRRKMTVAVPSSIENLKTEEEKEIEEENKVLDANILDEQPSGLLTISNSQEPEYPGGDMMVDGNCTVPSNSPSVYSLPSTRIDMDTVD